MERVRNIGVIGCGNMGAAIARRLSSSGYDVFMGSRRPEHHKYRSLPAEITSVVECVQLSSILFIAIYPEYYNTILIPLADNDQSLFDGKILIDISNPTGKERKCTDDALSNAEQLQIAIPNATVVKGFNTIPAFLMENIAFGQSPCVVVASDDSIASDRVTSLAKSMGFESYNGGTLRTARHIESSNQSFFPKWRIPVIVTTIILIIWFLFICYKKFVTEHQTSWHQLFACITNKAVCASAITLLAIVYMGSNLAGIFQLAYGTRLRRFPAWLDSWLLSRKQFGLLTFLLALFHAIISLILISPEYYRVWYQPAETIILPDKNHTRITLPSRIMNWNGELAALLGVLAFVTMSLLAVVSIPAIGNFLNWREWQFIQSRLGTFLLLLAIGHVLAMAMPDWVREGPLKIFSSIRFPIIVLPVVTVVLKFILCLPCFSRPISRIRRGDNLKEHPLFRFD